MRFRKGGALFAAALAVLLAHRVGGQAAPSGPLTPSLNPFTTSFLVTGDFAATTLDLQGPTGKLKMSGVPKDADILAAFMYVEAIHLKSQSPKNVVAGATFRNMPLTGARTKGMSQDLTGPTTSCYASNTPLTMTELRFDVLHMLPRQLDKFGKPTGKLLVNDADLPQKDKLLFSFPDTGGNLVPQFAGATLVVLFRHPDYPLRKIVVNDGIRILGPGEEPEQKIGGFYESDPLNRKATLLIMGGAGAKNTTDALVFNGSVVKQDPFPASSSSSDRSWSGAAIDVSSQMPGTTVGDFGETVSFKITHGKTSPYECIAVAGSWFSVTVADRDGFRGEQQNIVAGDGIPDRLEQAGGPLREPNGMLLPDVYAWGARADQMDDFIEVNAFRTTEDRTDGSANAPYDVTVNPIVNTMTVPAHDHMPPPEVIVKFVDALKNAPVKNKNGTLGIRARVDVGNRGAYHSRGAEYAPTVGASDDDYLFRDEYARGGETDVETKCNPADRACHFPDYGGVMGWGYSTQRYLLGMDRDPTGHSPRLDKNRNGNGLVNYAVFGHWSGRPKSLPCLNQYGTPTLYDSPTSQTCANGPNPGFDSRLYRVPTSSSGSAALPGFIHQETMGGWEKFVGTPLNRATTWLHEWAHNVGIWHGGPPARLVYGPAGVEKITAANCNPFYHSVSNYDYQSNGVLNLNNVGQVVLSDRKNASLQESTLKDLNIALPFRSAWFVRLGNGTLADSLGLEPAKKLCVGGAVTGAGNMARFDGPPSASIDWATNGFVLDSSAAGQDINYDGKADTVMDGYNDWANIRLDQRGSGHIMGGGVSNGGSDFGGSDFGGSDFGGSDFGGSDFGGSDFGGSDFGGSDFGGSDFGGLDRDGSDFGGSDFGGSDFGGTGFAGDAELTHEAAVALGSTAPTELNACVIGGNSPGPNYPRSVNGNPVGTPACETGASGQTHRTRVRWKAPSVVPQPAAAQPITEYRILRAAGATPPIQVAAVTPTAAGCPTTGDLCTYFLNEEFPDGLPVTIYVKALFSDNTTGSAANTAIIARNDAPVAIADARSVNEDTVLTGNVLVPNPLTGDSDIDSPILIPVLIAGPVHAAANGFTLDAAGNFSYTPAQDYYGTDAFTYKLVAATFSGPPAQPMSPDSLVVTVQITVNPVNDVPAFNRGPDDTVLEDSGPRSVPNWATPIGPPYGGFAGPGNEITCPAGFSSPDCNQAVDFIVSNNNTALFSVQPAISPTGTLTYTPAANANGSAVVMVAIHDNGGGADTSAPQTFAITVTPVNDAPAGTNGSVTTVANTDYTFSNADFGFTDPNDALPIAAAGPGALLGVQITTLPAKGALKNNGAPVTAGQEIAASDITAGNLKFSPATNESGTPYTSFTFQVRDDGGTANSGTDLDPTANTLTINVISVTAGPDMSFARRLHSSTLLANGTVLVAGGRRACVTGEACNTVAQASAELYDPTTNAFSPTGNLVAGRQEHIAISLDANHVLLAGGFSDAAGGPIASAEIYDVSAGTFSSIASMTKTREEAAAVKLVDGRVLVAGGYGTGMGDADLYDPVTGMFTTTAAMTVSRSLHTATLLPDGTVLIVGGFNGSSIATAELFDPNTGTFTATTGGLIDARHGHTAALLSNGKVLIAGGVKCVPDCSTGVTLSSAELYDPSSGTFSSAGTMTTPRQEFTATILADGKVLLSGGRSSGVQTATLEVYDPTGGTFTAVAGTMSTGRASHAATLLPNGKVLITGGDGPSSPFLKSTSLFQP